MQRILEVCNELIETEIGYTTDIVSIVEIFYLPLLETNLITIENLQGIFSNIEQIAAIHTKIVNDLQTIPATDTLSIIRTFEKQVPRYLIF